MRSWIGDTILTFVWLLWIIQDYSGDYVIELLPCTVTPTQSYNIMPDMPVVCTAHPPEK